MWALGLVDSPQVLQIACSVVIHSKARITTLLIILFILGNYSFYFIGHHIAE
jgi:hypothetical protein